MVIGFVGYYCTGPGEEMYEDKPCPAGFYCPQGTTISTQDPCPGKIYPSPVKLHVSQIH